MREAGIIQKEIENVVSESMRVKAAGMLEAFEQYLDDLARRSVEVAGPNSSPRRYWHSLYQTTKTRRPRGRGFESRGSFQFFEP